VKIRCLKHSEINFNKYNACILTAYNTRIYGMSWYLNCVTNKDWEVLVLEDYYAVMPLPFGRIKRKFFKRTILQPMYTQQLGIFSLTELDSDTIQQFLDEFNTLKPYVYHFNSENTARITSKLELRNNYELKLNISYSDIQKNYSKNTIRNLKKAFKNELFLTNEITIEDFIRMKNNNKKHSIKKKQRELMSQLIQQIIAQKKGNFYGVKKEKQLIAIAFIIETETRLIHLFSASTALGKQTGATFFLFDNIIQKNTNSELIFDFEGSMIEGVAKFFKSFGAKNNIYLKLDNSNA